MPVKVLLVDDHPTLTLVIKRFLKRMESVVVVGEAATGQEALKLVEEIQPDVIVLDIRLDDMSGFDVAQEVMSRRPDTKIIMVSAQLDPAAARKAFEAGAMGVVPKDHIFEELLQAIQTVTQSRIYVSDSIES